MWSTNLHKTEIWPRAIILMDMNAFFASVEQYAAKLQKPNGFVVIPPWEAKEKLSSVPVTQLCGIGRKTGEFLAKYGVQVCGDMEKIPSCTSYKIFRQISFTCALNSKRIVARY